LSHEKEIKKADNEEEWQETEKKVCPYGARR
jgi:hypothetical protein